MHNGTRAWGSLEIERLELTAVARELGGVRAVDMGEVELFKVRAAAPDRTDGLLRQLFAMPVMVKRASASMGGRVAISRETRRRRT